LGKEVEERGTAPAMDKLKEMGVVSAQATLKCFKDQHGRGAIM
jgi:hypothetical protein